MTRLATLAAAIVVAALAPYAALGAPLFHAGWFNVALAALIVLVLRDALRLTRREAARAPWIGAIAAGVTIVGVAAIASGLFAPDESSVVGAPGTRVPVADLHGDLAYPLATGDAVTVGVERAGRVVAGIPATHPSVVGTFVARQAARRVVAVNAQTLDGRALTVTQPTSSAFLSPVMLMQTQQTISGMTLPVDSFALPAMHRDVHVYLFTHAQAQGFRNFDAHGRDAVLFAVDGGDGRPLRDGIAIARSGEPVVVGGVRLAADVVDYPAIVLVPIPSIPLVALGLLISLGGIIGYTRKF